MKKRFFLYLIMLTPLAVLAQPDSTEVAISDSVAVADTTAAIADSTRQIATIPPAFSLIKHLQKMGFDTTRVYTIDRFELEVLHLDRIDEVFQAIPMLTVRHSGGPGQPFTAGPGVQPTADLTVLINGFPATDWYVGQTVLSSIPVALIERVEYLPPDVAATAWNGAGGVVNLITHSGALQRPRSSVRYLSGDKATSRYQIRVAGPMNTRSQGLFSYDFQETDGYRDFNHAKDADFFGNIGTRFGDWDVIIQGRSESRRIHQADNVLAPLLDVTTRDYRNEIGMALRRRNFRQHVQFLRQSVTLFAPDSTLGRYQYDSYFSQTEFAADFDGFWFGASTNFHYFHVRDQYVQADLPTWLTGRATVELGKRLSNRWQVAGTLTGDFHWEEGLQLGLAGSLNYRFNSDWTFGAGVKQSPRFEAPQNWLAQNVTTASETIQHAASDVLFLRAQGQKAGVDLTLGLVWQHVDPIEGYSLFNPGVPLAEVDQDGANVGVHMAAKYPFFQESWVQTALILNQADDDITASYMPVKLNVQTVLSYRFFQDALTLRWQGGGNYFQRDDGGERSDFLVLDTGVSADFGNLSIQFRFQNLTDETYAELPGGQMPGFNQQFSIYWVFWD